MGYYSIPGYSDLGSNVSADNVATRDGRFTSHYDQLILTPVMVLAPEDFGAAGNGVQDDGPALRAALAAASRTDASYGGLLGATGFGLYLSPRKTYRALPAPGSSAVLPVTAANTMIVGGGPTTVLQLGDHAPLTFGGCDLLSFSSAVTRAYVGNLTLDANGANQDGITRTILLNGCSGVWIDRDVVLANTRTRSIAGAGAPRDITVGSIRFHLDARVLGATGNGNLQSNASVAGGSNQVTVAGATAAMSGRSFEVEQAGAADGLVASPGWRNLVGYAKFVSAVRLDMYADAALATPLVAGNSVTGARAVIATDDTSRLADLLALSQACGGLPCDLPPGVYYTGQQILHSGDIVEGAGAGVTYVKAKQGNTAFTAQTDGNIQVRGLTIDGFGPDGGASGAAFQACISLFDVQDVLIEDVTCRNAHVGVSVNNQTTDDVTLRRVRSENMLKSNGTYNAAATGGIGIWIFNGPHRVKLEGCTTDGTDLHGIYFDPGTTTQTQPSQHGFIDAPVGSNLQIHNAARSGLGVGFGLQGVRWGSFSSVSIDTVGKDPLLGTYSDCEALAMTGDQNGEYPVDTNVVGVSIKDAGGKAVWLQGKRCRVQGTVDGFNRSGSSSSTWPIQIDSYTGFNVTGVTIQGPDPSYNTVDLEAFYRDTDPTKFTHAALIVGGTSVPDGRAGAGTRTAQALGNVIRGRFVHQGRKYADGALDIGVSTTTLTSASAIFLPGDVGKRLDLQGAGPAGAVLATSIAAWINATQVTLADAASTTVSGATFFVGVSRPSTGMLSLSGGATNCPSEGPNANVAVGYGMADQPASLVDHAAVQGEAFSRWNRTAGGRQNLGGGASTYDVTVERIIAGVYGVTTGAFQARQRVLTYAGDGAVAITPGVAKIAKGSAAALTLADPAVGDEGTVLIITAQTAFAHTVSNAAGSGFNNGGGASDVATFGGAVGDSLMLVAINTKWNVVSARNVTLG